MFPNIWAQRFQQMPMGQFPQRPMPQAPMQQPPVAPWQQPMVNRFAPMQGQMPMQQQMPMQPMQQPMQQFPNAYAGFRPAGMQM